VLIELDMPERTTRDFTRFTSTKVQILTQKVLIELDMPERTTRDYEERDLLSEVLNPKP
jgi:hypothetical protein